MRERAVMIVLAAAMGCHAAHGTGVVDATVDDAGVITDAAAGECPPVAGHIRCAPDDRYPACTWMYDCAGRSNVCSQFLGVCTTYPDDRAEWCGVRPPAETAGGVYYCWSGRVCAMSSEGLAVGRYDGTCVEPEFCDARGSRFLVRSASGRTGARE